MTVGLDLLGRITVVHWTWRGRDIRLISARPATSGERRRYQHIVCRMLVGMSALSSRCVKP